MPLFIAIMSGIFTAGVDPGLLLLGHMLGEASYPRARFFAFAAAAARPFKDRAGIRSAPAAEAPAKTPDQGSSS